MCVLFSSSSVYWVRIERDRRRKKCRRPTHARRPAHTRPVHARCMGHEHVHRARCIDCAAYHRFSPGKRRFAARHAAHTSVRCAMRPAGRRKDHDRSRSRQTLLRHTASSSSFRNSCHRCGRRSVRFRSRLACTRLSGTCSSSRCSRVRRTQRHPDRAGATLRRAARHVTYALWTTANVLARRFTQLVARRHHRYVICFDREAAHSPHPCAAGRA